MFFLAAEMPATRAISSGLPLGLLGKLRDHRRLHFHEGMRARRALGGRLGGNVHHARRAGVIVVS